MLRLVVAHDNDVKTHSPEEVLRAWLH